MQQPHQDRYHPCFCAPQPGVNNFRRAPHDSRIRYAHEQHSVWAVRPNHSQIQGNCVIRALWSGIVHGNGYLTAVKFRWQICEVDSGAVKSAWNVFATIHPADVILMTSIELCGGSETKPCRREEKRPETAHVVAEKNRRAWK